MTDIAHPRTPLLHRIPVIGWFARDLSRDFHGNIGYFALILVTALILAVKTWGLVALSLTALAATPVIMLLLIAITVGR